MNARIEYLIKTLHMLPHPEGGYYSEVYRSELPVTTPNGERNLMTSIYFLLTSKDVSRFHVIASDELWFHHEGSDLTVHLLDEKGHTALKLGSKEASSRPQQLVRAGKIFGSTVDTPESYALVSCAVAPGFDFRDFKLFDRAELVSMFPEYDAIISRLT
jgi:predicted cupin superfamily sugar epimerase